MDRYQSNIDSEHIDYHKTDNYRKNDNYHNNDIIRKFYEYERSTTQCITKTQ